MRILQIATVGPSPEPVLIGVREHPVHELVLVDPGAGDDAAEDLLEALDPIGLDVEVRPTDGFTGIIETITEVAAEAQDAFDDIYVNVSGGMQLAGCAALSAAYINGLKAIDVCEGRPRQLPVLEFSYHEVVSDRKIELLRALAEAGGSVDGLKVVASRIDTDKSLVSYHLRGTDDVKGMEDLGLVAIERGVQGRLEIEMTPMGRLLLALRERRDEA